MKRIEQFAKNVLAHLDQYGEEADVWWNLASGLTGREDLETFEENAHFDKIDAHTARAYCADIYEGLVEALLEDDRVKAVVKR